MFPSPAPKNPSVDKMSFQALERRVAALEELISSMVATGEGEEQQQARRGRKPKAQETE